METKRCSNNKEHDLLFDESNDKNMDNFKNIIPYFYYDDDTNDRIYDEIDTKLMSEDNKYLDEMLNLNNQRRAFYSVNKSEDLDKGYREYRNELYNSLSIKDELYGRLCDYKVFSENSIVIDKQPVKLFKYLLKKEIFTKAQVDRINNYKTGDDLYVCISRNPVDMLFCSTNQSFSSCESLCSDYSGAFYMALGALPLDPNRAIMFLTNGKIKRYDIKDYEFKHFRYICRSWLLLDKDSSLHVIRHYPSSSMDFDTILRSIGYKINIDDFSDSKFKFEPGSYENGEHVNLYLDNIGRKYTNNKIYYTYLGTTGCDEIFNCSSGFESIEDFDSLNNNNTHACVSCNCSVEDDYSYFNEDGDPYCEECYNDRYSSCYSCGDEVCLESDCTYRTDNGYYCSGCFHDKYIICDNCGESELIGDSIVLSDSSHTYCEGCGYDLTFYCEECEYVYENDDESTIGNMCLSCFGESHFVCSNCEETKKNDEESPIGNMCKDCFEESHFVCDICGEICDIKHKIDVDAYINVCEMCYEWEERREICNS